MHSIVKDLIPLNVKRSLKSVYKRACVSGKPKIFGVGRNKTGTTSLKAAMEELGFVVGHQLTKDSVIF